MNHSSILRIGALCVAVSAFAAGCEKDDQVRTYQAPKDQVAQVQPDQMQPSAPGGQTPVAQAPAGQMPAAAAPAGDAGTAPMSWTVPDGWTSTQGNSMTLAAFQVDPGNAAVKCTVTPLPLIDNAIQTNVNRWEGQVGLAPTDPKDIAKVVKVVKVGDQDVNIVDLQGEKGRMLGAIIERDQLWFIKLAGPKEVIAAQTEKFDAFIKSLKFTDQPQAMPPQAGAMPADPHAGAALPPGDPHAGMPMPPVNPNAAPPAPAADRGVTWTLPAGWAEAANPSPMRVATLKAGDAELIASRLNAQGWGNLLDNINRWRGQTGLEPITDPTQQPAVATEVNGLKWTTYDLTGPQKRLMVAFVTNGESIWFFRLGGKPEAVEAQKTALDSFVKSIKFQ